MRTLIPLVFLTASSAFLNLPGRQPTQPAEPAEEQPTAEAERLFDSVHCEKPSRLALAVFSGCWRVASAWSVPTEENLALGMRGTEESFQLLIESSTAGQAVHFRDPRYCTFAARPTVAPAPNTGSSSKTARVYLMSDLPASDAGAIALEVYPEVRGDIRARQYMQLVEELARRDAAYVRTLVVEGPESVRWEQDRRWDFWAVPAPCNGWEAVAEKLERESAAAPSP